MLRPAVETNDPRRGNSLPREGLQPCVAPYFADGCRRHAGTAAVRRENATPEAVAGRHRTTQRPDTQCNICYTTADATAPHPSGVRFGGCTSAVPACRHDPAWRNTGLRTAATPRGVAEMSASGHRAMHRIAWALPACRHDPATYQSIRYRGRLYRPRVAKCGHRLRRWRRGGRCAAPDLAALAAAAMRSIARFLQPMLLMGLMGPMGDMAVVQTHKMEALHSM